MTDPIQSRQQRARLLGVIEQLLKRYEELFNEPAKPRLQKWLQDRIEAAKDETLKSSLSHFEPSELLELLALLNEEKLVAQEIKEVQVSTPPTMETFVEVVKRRGRPRK